MSDPTPTPAQVTVERPLTRAARLAIQSAREQAQRAQHEARVIVGQIERELAAALRDDFRVPDGLRFAIVDDAAGAPVALRWQEPADQPHAEAPSEVSGAGVAVGEEVRA